LYAFLNSLLVMHVPPSYSSLESTHSEARRCVIFSTRFLFQKCRYSHHFVLKHCQSVLPFGLRNQILYWYKTTGKII
jgi:hypothetical protein